MIHTLIVCEKCNTSNIGKVCKNCENPLNTKGKRFYSCSCKTQFYVNKYYTGTIDCLKCKKILQVKANVKYECYYCKDTFIIDESFSGSHVCKNCGKTLQLGGSSSSFSNINFEP